jgi:hypothetical protein
MNLERGKDDDWGGGTLNNAYSREFTGFEFDETLQGVLN